MKSKILQFILWTIVLMPIISYAQKKRKNVSNYVGYVYVSDDRSTIPFKYKLSFAIDTLGNYVSKYKVYIDGNYKFDVIASHDKTKKIVNVEVDVPGGGILAAVAEPQVAKYNFPSLQPFGNGGVVRILEGSQVPYELAIKFANSQFTYVKIISVLGYHGNDGADYFVFK